MAVYRCFVEKKTPYAVEAAGVLGDLREGRLEKGETVVAVLTGHGLKDMKSLPEGAPARLIENAANIAEALY